VTVLDSEIRSVGQTLADAVPSGGRNPLRALDQKAMEVAERDQQLRAALFRLVDVTPACRSLDDLAEHLAGYLDEVDERTTPLDAAMRMAGSRTGRKALGAAAAAGVRHMAHRFIVGESARGALKPIGELWA
jgi:proline dehydrogenase